MAFRSGVALFSLAVAAACRGEAPPPKTAPEAETPAPIALLESRRIPGRLALTHAGVGSTPDLADGPRDAAAEALVRMEAGESALDGALAGTVALEDDPRFNAGTGANIRLDGQTIQMDASLMTDEGEFAAVAVIERVRNPVLVAREVLESPHVLLAGEGATRFAHRLGFEDVVPVSEPARQKYRRRLAAVSAKLGKDPVDWPALWNFPNPLPPELSGDTDTVGTVTRDGADRFAATLSTGGTSVTLYGRVGDVPVYGAGLFAGPAGAVACTGVGEVIVRESLAKSVYAQLEAGVEVREAVHRAVARFPDDVPIGIIAVDPGGWAVGANEPMAYGVAPNPP